MAASAHRCKMGMSLLASDLLPGERHVKSKLANMVVSVRESGLSRFAFDDYMGLIGMKGREAIGGRIHLTNYRIIFKSHFFNRVRGKHSVFLPNVVAASATFNNLIVETSVQRFEFVMWFKRAFLASINDQKSCMTSNELEMLRTAIVSHPQAVGVGLNKCVTLETINQISMGTRKISPLLEKLSGAEKMP